MMNNLKKIALMFALASVAVTTNVKAASLPRGAAIGVLAIGAVWGIYKYFYSADETPFQKKLNCALRTAKLELAKSPTPTDKEIKAVRFQDPLSQVRFIPSRADLVEEEREKERLELETMRLHDAKGENAGVNFVDAEVKITKPSGRRGPPPRSNKQPFGLAFRS